LVKIFIKHFYKRNETGNYFAQELQLKRALFGLQEQTLVATTLLDGAVQTSCLSIRKYLGQLECQGELPQDTVALPQL
jgi:hypothetical protein